MTADANLDFVHFNGMAGKLSIVEVTGSGGAVFDYDNDGDLDLYLVQGRELEPQAATGMGQASGPMATPVDRLYRNDLAVMPDGSRMLHFTDVTEQSGLRATGYGMGLAAGDYNNDGRVDLYITNWGSNQLWRNNGDGTFSDVTRESGTDDPRWSTSAAFLDFDRDGWMDLVVVNYVAYSLETDHPCYSTRSGARDYCGPNAYPPEPDRILRNRGDGTFEDATLRTGMAAAYGAALGVVAADFNGDGWPDIYVANDGMENQMWMNRAGRAFENEAVASGAAVNADGVAEASMGVDAADLDGDGDEDLFMSHLDTETNTVYLNNGQGLFDDRSRSSGLGMPSWLYTGFGTAALDYDNDGWLDVFVANGAVRIVEGRAKAGESLALRQRNQLFRNFGQGRFEEVHQAAGGAFDLLEVSRGAAFGDIDNDGDTDVLLLNNNGPARLLQNEVGQLREWLGLRLIGTPRGRDMLGTRVALLRSDGSALWRRAHTDGSYCSASDPRVLFGLGKHPEYEVIRVFWPGGEAEEWRGLQLRTYHTLVKGQGKQVSQR